MLDSKHLQSIIDTLQSESDRACAVLGVATLDALLERLCRKAMLLNGPQQLYQQIFSGTGALATFSAKIDLAYALGLIDSQDHSDLHILRRIRNDFAHAIKHDLSFSTTEVVDRVRALELPQLFAGQLILAGGNDTNRPLRALHWNSRNLALRLPHSERHTCDRTSEYQIAAMNRQSATPNSAFESDAIRRRAPHGAPQRKR